MKHWRLAMALVALSLAGCDVPLEGLRDPSGVDAAGSADADPDAYISTAQHTDSGATSPSDAGHDALEDGSDEHAVEAGEPDSPTRADAREGPRHDD